MSRPSSKKARYSNTNTALPQDLAFAPLCEYYCSTCDIAVVKRGDQRLITSNLLTYCTKCLRELPEERKYVHSSVLHAFPPPRSLIIRKSAGSLLRYGGSNDILHCGISDETGETVYGLDERGVRIDKKRSWHSSLAVTLDSVLNADQRCWSIQLEQHVERELIRLTGDEKYHKLEYNCFDFVVRFMNSVRHPEVPEFTKQNVVASMLNDVVSTWDSEHFVKREMMHAANGSASITLSAHHGVQCDSCGVCPIVGRRYKCFNCADFDLCSTCFAKHSDFLHEATYGHEAKWQWKQPGLQRSSSTSQQWNVVVQRR